MTTLFDPALKTLMGALIIFPAGGGARQVIVFQLNPASLRRKLEPQVVGGDRQAQAARIMYAAAPTESIEVELELDATLQLPPIAGQTATTDLRPQLAALESLLYPSASQVQNQQTMLQAGTLEIGPYLAPAVVFTWGTARAVPVKLTSYSVTEEAFASTLAPIRARVSLAMQVLSYSDVSPQDPAYSLFLAYQSAKQQQASAGGFSNAGQQIIGVDPASLE